MPARCFPALRLSAIFLLTVLSWGWLRAEDVDYSPTISEASDEGERAIQGFQFDPTLKVELVAAEPDLANPVAFCLDERGRIYVAETFRLHSGVTDTRQHMDWLDEDLASRTIDDRLAKYRKFLGDEFASYGIDHDRLRLLEDTDGDGRADRATVFADGFNGPEEGIGAGVLARHNDVYYACIPNLWLLRDTDGDGRADTRESLHYGYGVHTGFLGHDLHGLIFGPDGKLYFSMGDRGLNVATEGRQLFFPDTGCVLRCEPDGSDLEVFATGLRNPQELAFNEYGDLFTGDNNSDGGDRARWVHVLEGGDSGWRMGYQYMDRRGPWNAEKLWYPHFPGQAAYLVPPLLNLCEGPSGVVYYPGTGLSDRYRGHFFLVDFLGTNLTSGVRSFALEPKGASYEVVDSHQFLWGILATDVDFGPDSKMYVLDWVQGWNKPTKGRIYRVAPEANEDEELRREVAALLAEDLENRSAESLIELFGHPNMRVRQQAQFALAKKGSAAAQLARTLAEDPQADRLPRIHAIWALGQIARQERSLVDPLIPLLSDGDAEVRAQAAKVLGDARRRSAAPRLIALLENKSPRVRLHAAIALGKLGDRNAVAPLLKMLAENGDADPFLRHAGVMGLVGSVGSGDVSPLLDNQKAESSAARMGVLLALRRLERSEVAKFLQDSDPLIVAEAARAIYDVPISDALPDLAALARSGTNDPVVLLRALHANSRLGRPENAGRIARVAADHEVPDSSRRAALQILRDWAEPSGRDGVVGLWRPFESRPRDVAAQSLVPVLAKLFAGSDRFVSLVAETIGELRVKEATPYLHVQFADSSRSGSARAAALKSLAMLEDEKTLDAVTAGVDDASAIVRSEARRIRAQLDPASAVRDLATALETGSIDEQQKALATLGTMKTPEAEELLHKTFERLRGAEVDDAVRLDVLLAAEAFGSERLKRLLLEYESQRPADPVEKYRECLEGGDAAKGQEIFFENAKVYCQRCHVVGDRGGGRVGPELTTIAREKDRRYLLESIVNPNQVIAKGFESVVVALDDGRVIAGVLQSEDENNLRLISPEAITMNIDKSRIEERAEGRSAMPEQVVTFLSKSELRDLIEYLSTLR